MVLKESFMILNFGVKKINSRLKEVCAYRQEIKNKVTVVHLKHHQLKTDRCGHKYLQSPCLGLQIVCKTHTRQVNSWDIT